MPDHADVNVDMDEEEHWRRHVYRGDQIPEATARAFAVGALLAGLMVTFNVYMGMRTGWGAGGSIIAVILSYSIVRAFAGRFSILENNMCQTMASAGGSIGNIVNVIPALYLLAGPQIALIDQVPSTLQIFWWIFFTSFLGVFFAIPLRKQIVIVEKLRFPTGTACAETIEAMHAAGPQAARKSRLLFGIGGFGGLVTWLRDGWPAVVPAASYLSGAIKGCSLQSLTLGISWSPMMFGAGFLVGPRVGVSMLIGALLAFGVLAPGLFHAGVLSDVAAMLGRTEPLTAPVYPVIVKWTMWPGLALMIAYGIAATAMKGKLVLRALRSMAGMTAGNADSGLEFPFKWWLAGLLLASAGVVGMLAVVFGVPVWAGALSVPISFVFAAIAVRATGETDINPVGAMGAVTQIVFGAVHPSAATTLLTGGVAASGASESADMMQDLKTGYLLGATPRRQTYFQLAGVLFGALVAVPIFMVLIEAYGIGSEKLPAPAAVTWSGLAQMMAKGLSGLPEYADLALLAGAIVGIGVAVLEHRAGPWRRFLPSAVGLGVAMVVPAIYSVSIFCGAAAMWLIKRRHPQWIDANAGTIGAGGIAGEGLVGVLCAVLVVLGLL